MKKPEPYIDENGDRYLNLSQAAEIICGYSRRTLTRFAEAGKTSFGFPLTIKRVPVLKHRAMRPGRVNPLKPQTARVLMLEQDVEDLKAIVQAADRNEPGPWSPYELATLEARATTVMRRRELQSNGHRARPQLSP